MSVTTQWDTEEEEVEEAEDEEEHEEEEPIEEHLSPGLRRDEAFRSGRLGRAQRRRPRRGRGSTSQDPREVRSLLRVIDRICSPSVDWVTKQCDLEDLSVALRPQRLRTESRRIFVQRALDRGVVKTAVTLIELGGADIATATSNFLGDFAFNSDVGARAVLQVFDRIAERFRRIFEDLTWENMALLDAAILLCVNIAATCPAGHSRLIPLVKPVCLQIIQDSRVTEKLRGNTILLLANLSMTVSQELRSLHVANALLDLILEDRTSDPGKSVAESVVIFLHGDRKCEEVDRLMEADVIGKYCVPIMELTLKGEEFRGMYPHLFYSAQLFHLLAQSREYAEALVSHERVVPLLLEANKVQGPLRVESDLEGRRLVLEALSLLANFGLWPPEEGEGECDAASHDFLTCDLPKLMCDRHAGIRGAASNLWARLHLEHIHALFLTGARISVERRLPFSLWREKVLSFLFPRVAHGEL